MFRIRSCRLDLTNWTSWIQGLFYNAEGLQRDLQHKNNELQDQKKLVQVYRGDAEKCQNELDAKSRKEVRPLIASVR